MTGSARMLVTAVGENSQTGIISRVCVSERKKNRNNKKIQVICNLDDTDSKLSSII